MRQRCTFTYTGRPVTKPGTPADTKRIALSRWITDMLVHNSEEAAGDYLIPGESGYTPDQMSLSATHYSHLAEKPVVPEAELKTKAIQLLRDGYRQDEIATQIGVTYGTLVEWRKNSQYAEKWDAAYAHGKFNRRNSNAVRDSKTAQRVQPAPAPPPARPAPAPVAPTLPPAPVQTTKKMPKAHLSTRAEKQLQDTILDRLCKGEKAADMMKDYKQFNATRLAEWRKNPRFVTRWDEARRIGADFLKTGGVPPTPEPTPLFTTVPATEKVVDNVRFGQPARTVLPSTEEAYELQAPRLTEHAGPEPSVPYADYLAKSQELHDTGLDLVMTYADGQTERQPLKFTLTPEFAEGPQAPVEAAPTEQVNGPSHYNGRETYDQMLALFGKEQVLAFCRITAYKYQSRAGKKAGNSWEQDMAKMNWYLDRIKELTA